MVLDEDTRLGFGAVSTGNPHAVIEVADVDDVPVSRYGSALQQSPAFAESAHVGFAQVVARDRIRLRVFQRGVGETLACGRGARTSEERRHGKECVRTGRSTSTPNNHNKKKQT